MVIYCNNTSTTGKTRKLCDHPLILHSIVAYFWYQKQSWKMQPTKIVLLIIGQCSICSILTKEWSVMEYTRPPHMSLLKKLRNFQILNRMSDRRVFPLFNGYLQQALKPGISRESPSVTSPEGERRCFTRLPFGHHLSSAMFSSVKNRVFGPMRIEAVWV